jgi:hypothetical protein
MLGGGETSGTPSLRDHNGGLSQTLSTELAHHPVVFSEQFILRHTGLKCVRLPVRRADPGETVESSDG